MAREPEKIVMISFRKVVFLLSFCVVLSLLHLVVGEVVWYAIKGKVALHPLVKDGSLLFFATTLSASSMYEHMAKGLHREREILFVFSLIGAIVIIVAAMAIYGVLVYGLATNGVPFKPEVITELSVVISIVAIIFSLTLLVITEQSPAGGKV